jgi:hypothetical protein
MPRTIKSYKDDIFECYDRYYLPVYADLIAFLADKPKQVLVEFENIATHLIKFLQGPKHSIKLENIQKTHDHLVRITIDCSKLLWVEMDKKFEAIFNDKWIRKFGLNISEGDFCKNYELFKKKAREARKIELESIGENPIKCFNKYAEVIAIGWQTLESYDPVKVEALKRHKIIYIIKSHSVSASIGFILGIIASYFATYLWAGSHPPTPPK